MIKSYGKEAYYKLEELTNSWNENDETVMEWQEHFSRVEVVPNTKITVDYIKVNHAQKVEYSLVVVPHGEGINKVEVYVDHVCMGVSTLSNGRLMISSSFYLLPTSTMQLLFYGDFTSQSVLLHSSIKGDDLVVKESPANTLFSYTENDVYALHLLDDTYYLTKCAFGKVPTLMTFGKTSTSCSGFDDFVVSDYYGDVTVCMLAIQEGDVLLTDLMTGKTISITDEGIDYATVTITASADYPIGLLCHGEDGWQFAGITKEFTLGQFYTCDTLDTVALPRKFDKIQGITSVRYSIGMNGFLGLAKGKVYYFMPTSHLPKQDMIQAVLLNLGKVKSVWGVELSDGIHLVAKNETGLIEYLLTKENSSVKLTTIMQASNAQDLVYDGDKKYILYEDKLYLVE